MAIFLSVVQQVATQEGLGLDVVNLIIFILKKIENNLQKSQIFFFFHFLNLYFARLQKFATKKHKVYYLLMKYFKLLGVGQCFFQRFCDVIKVMIRSKHVTRSQKRCQMLDIISQNQNFIFLLPFKTIVIMASQSFFPHMNVKKLRVQIHLIQF